MVENARKPVGGLSRRERFEMDCGRPASEGLNPQPHSTPAKVNFDRIGFVLARECFFLDVAEQPSSVDAFRSLPSMLSRVMLNVINTGNGELAFGQMSVVRT